jgi:hypothetical protein
MFPLTPSVAADTGIHIGDGHLYIRQMGPDTNYSYDVTGNAFEDQLYLLGHVIPTVESAYNIHKFGIYVDPMESWITIVFQSKEIALFKHNILGLPNGRKTSLSIPRVILEDARLMRYCVREILATDGLLGFYNASRKGLHKYARIQITMTAWRVLEQIATFLRGQVGIDASCRFEAEPGSSVWRPRHRLQINGSVNIEKWRKEIGFSNPSHISRLMIFETLGECPCGTNTLNRLSYLTGCSSGFRGLEPLPWSAFESAISRMKKEFGSPDLNAHQMVESIQSVNLRLQHLARELPRIVDPRTIVC